MNPLFRIYLNILYNFFSCLFLLRFSETELKKKIPLKNKLIYLTLFLLYSIPEDIPLSALFCLSCDFLLLLSCLYPKFKKTFFLFIKYEIIYYTFPILILFVHTLVLNDTYTISISPVYQNYKATIVVFLLYIFYVLFTNTKKMRNFHNHYQIYFNLVILSISLMLSYVTLYICMENPDSYVLPSIFATIAVLIILCISLYDKFLSLLTENSNYKIQAEIDRMEQEYAAHVEENLKDIHSIRHDIKNHLIIIDGYASQQNFDKIHEYIGRIAGNFSAPTLIETASPTVSAILNQKQQLAKQHRINCEIETDFSHISIDDFTITTILSNLLDNAITAASKCSKGWVKAVLQQSESYLKITIDNNHMEQIQEKDGVFTSTKKDKNMFHGIGIKNVRKVVDTLNGQIEITYTENTFHVFIFVPNYI